MAKRNRPSAAKAIPVDWGDVRAEHVAYDSGATIFSQGQPATTVIYIEKGIGRVL